MADAQDPLEDAEDPTEDTPDGEDEDTAEADDSSQSDWTPKDRSEATRKITELAQENARLRREFEDADAQSEDDADDDDAEDDEPEGNYLDRQNALLASELYGPEVTDAADAVWPFLETAQTTADYVAVLEAYYEARLNGPAAENGKKPAETATNGAPARSDLTRPRVDTNRDGSPDSDDQIAEAVKSGSLDRFAGAAAAALGFGSSKPK
jgi:hypothetical protein